MRDSRKVCLPLNNEARARVILEILCRRNFTNFLNGCFSINKIAITRSVYRFLLNVYLPWPSCKKTIVVKSRNETENHHHVSLRHITSVTIFISTKRSRKKYVRLKAQKFLRFYNVKRVKDADI